LSETTFFEREDLRAAAFFLGAPFIVLFFEEIFRDIDLRAVVLRVVRFLAEAFLTIRLRAVVLRAVVLRVVRFLAEAFLTIRLRAVVLRAVVLRAVRLLAGLRAVVFFAVRARERTGLRRADEAFLRAVEVRRDAEDFRDFAARVADDDLRLVLTVEAMILSLRIWRFDSDSNALLPDALSNQILLPKY
jgi:hypothetical protein